MVEHWLGFEKLLLYFKMKGEVSNLGGEINWFFLEGPIIVSG